MKNKLKSSSSWELIDNYQYVILILKEIKNITFKFEDHKCNTISIHNEKLSFYSSIKNNLSNSEYYQKFRNMVEISISLGGNIHDESIIKWVSLDKYNLYDHIDSSINQNYSFKIT